MFKMSVSGLLVLSILSWTLGCTSFKPIGDGGITTPDRHKTIEVYTKDGYRYQLEEWTRDPDGNITGKGMVIDGPKGEYHRFTGTIAANRITKVTGKKFNVAETVALAAATVGFFVFLKIVIEELGEEVEEELGEAFELP